MRHGPQNGPLRGVCLVPKMQSVGLGTANAPRTPLSPCCLIPWAPQVRPGACIWVDKMQGPRPSVRLSQPGSQGTLPEERCLLPGVQTGSWGPQIHSGILTLPQSAMHLSSLLTETLLLTSPSLNSRRFKTEKPLCGLTELRWKGPREHQHPGLSLFCGVGQRTSEEERS